MVCRAVPRPQTGYNERFPEVRLSLLQSGDLAPDFEIPTLVAGVRKPFHLQEELSGVCILLAFYPHNWDPLTAMQLTEYQARRTEFLACGVETLAITVDSIMNSVAWEREIGPFEFPLGADFWPHGAVSESYGVLRAAAPFCGASERALFYISKHGRIEFSRVYPPDEAPLANDTLQIIRDLKG